MERRRLARLLLLVWSLWFAIVAASNLADLAVHVGMLPAAFWWKSGNLAQIAGALAPIGLEVAAVPLLGGVALWEAAASLLFLRALARAHRAPGSVVTAFSAGLGLFLLFVLLDEALLLYPSGIEGVHLQIVVALLASLLVVELIGGQRTTRT